LTTGTGHTVQSWSMPCKYRTIEHSPHSRNARITGTCTKMVQSVGGICNVTRKQRWEKKKPQRKSKLLCFMSTEIMYTENVKRILISQNPC